MQARLAATPEIQRLSTVLAQDHFFSDFLSLRLTKKNHTLTMMMSVGAASMRLLQSKVNTKTQGIRQGTDARQSTSRHW